MESGTEVVVINQAGRLAPAGAMILEVANEFALLGIHADDGRMSPAEAMTHVGNVVELEIAVCTGFGRQRLDVDSEGVIHIVQQPSDGIRRHADAIAAERFCDFDGCTPRPLQAGYRIASGIVVQQVLQTCNYCGRFFSVGVRPPPLRRVLPVTTSRSSNC